MRFAQRRGHPDVDRRRPSRSVDGDTTGVDAAPGDRCAATDIQVGRGNAEPGAAAVTVDHHAVQAVRTAEQPVRVGDVALCDQPTCTGRRDRLAVGACDKARDNDVDAPLTAGVTEHPGGAFSPVPETKVPPDSDHLRSDRWRREHLAESIPADMRERLGERDLQQFVDPESRDDPGTHLRGRQHRRLELGTKNGKRIGIERDDHRRHASLPGRLHRDTDDLAVTQMHSVERPDRDGTVHGAHR